MKIEFNDYSAKVLANLEKKGQIFLEEAKNTLANQTARNTKRVTGRLADSFTTDSVVVENTAYIGSSVEYAPYYELGTGEYALNGNGRKGGWVYIDKKTGKLVHTKGSYPRRPLYHAFQQKKESVKQRAHEVFK